ncbi:DUF4389 domain-containing protein [Nocardia yamanashiensis]|uniref:DUF4389 domain-containing protein n=1 Tax=Nocardia yamanashiensis TaxID=209247 RepID=UPI001E4B13B8|nr:DUF4389 domain-containing protein [Nocardia yamanashiensis]UGT41634.1 DUF4389 domain-containing protein [Nocardia yamanashiensis]
MDNATAYQPIPEPVVELDVFPPQQQRRWTVLLRLILAIPQLIVLWALGIAAAVVAIIGWFGALFTGALPQWAGDFLRSYVAYNVRVSGYMMLLVDAYPPFTLETGPDYPVRAWFPNATPLNRLAVLFRFFLALPILILTSWFASGWMVISFIVWLIVLITGRMPAALFQATTVVLRNQVRTSAYWYMLTPTYLKQVFGDGAAPEAGAALPPGYVPASPTRPLLVSQAGKILLWVILVLGILASIAQGVTRSTTDVDDDDYSSMISYSHTY